MQKLFKIKKEILVVAGSVFIISMFIFRKYIFEGYFFLSQDFLSDLLRANLPTYYQMYDSIFGDGNFWSWRMGIGTSMFSHADVYFDPFTYVLFIFGRDAIPAMMIWLFIIKLMAEGICFYKYLDYFHLDKRASVIASILYSFCGYSMIMGSNFALGTILVYAPLVLLGIEKWIEEGKIRTLVFSLFLTCIYFYYYFYIIGIMAALYLCVRLTQKRQMPFPKIFILVLLALLVIGMSAFSLLPQLQLVLASPRVTDSKDTSGSLLLFMPQLRVWLTALIRSLCGDILGNRAQDTYLGYSYFGAVDYFQVSCYVSVYLVILLVQYWENEKEKRKDLLAIIGISFILIIFPVFSYALNCFSTVSARWMFMLSIVECLGIAVSVDSIIKRERINTKGMVKGILLSCLIIVGGIGGLILTHDDRRAALAIYMSTGKRFLIAIIFLYVLFILLYLMQEKAKTVKFVRIVVGTLICVALILDVGINYYHSYGIEQSVCEYTEENNACYDDASADIIADIQSKDSSLFRINKNFDSVIAEGVIPSENDAMAQKYFGLKCYNSLNNVQYINFLQTVGIYAATPSLFDYYIENEIKPEEVTGSQLNYIHGVGNRYLLMNYLGVKYYMTKEKEELPEYFSFLYEKEGIKIYENKCCFPIAFINSDVISLSDFKQLSNEKKDNVLMQYTVVDSDAIEMYNPNKNEEFELSRIASDKQNSFSLISFSEDDFSFQINAQDDAGYLSFTIPYDQDWHVYIDGEEVETIKINVSMLGTEITSGQHTVRAVYRPKMFYVGIVISLVTAIVLLVLRKKITAMFLQLEKMVQKVLNRRACIIKKIYCSENMLKVLFFLGGGASALASGAGIACALQNATSGKISYFVVLFITVILIALGYVALKKIDRTTRYRHDANIGLCQVICILVIIAHYFVLYSNSSAMEGMTSNIIFSFLLITGGKLCFDCLMASSCWFLVDQDFKTKSAIKVWGMALLYSTIFAVIALLCQHEFPYGKLISAFLPIAGNSYGLVSSYIVLYLLLPFLAKISSGLTKKKARWLMIILLYLEVLSQIIGCINGYYQSLASEILLFILFYFIALNFKKWPLKIIQNKGIMISMFMGIWLILWAVRYNQAINPDNRALNIFMSTMCDETSIMNIVGGFAFFFFFKNIKMKKYPFINYLATGTLGILLIHNHNFFRNVLWNNIYNTTEWYDYQLWRFIAIIFCITLAIYIVCFIIDQLRKVLIEKPLFKSKYVNMLCENVDKIMHEEDTEN